MTMANITRPAVSRIQGLYETHLTVKSLEMSVPFYRDVVGLKLASIVEDRIAFLWIDDKQTAMLGLWQCGRAPLGLRLHLALKVSLEDVLGARDGLKRHGVQPLGFDSEPVDEPVVIGWMPAVAQYFSDPDGHSIEFIHVLDAEADLDFGVRSYSRWLARPSIRQ